MPVLGGGMAQTENSIANERMAALLRRERADRVPFIHKGYAFCAQNTGMARADIYEFPERSYFAQRWTMEQYNAEVAPFYTFSSYGAWEFGGTVEWPDDRWASGPSIASLPVQLPEDVFKLQLPDVTTAGCLPKMMAFARLQEKYGTRIAFIYGSPFTFAANVCGVDKFLLWTTTEPETVHHMLRLMTDHLKQVADYFISTFGAERVLPRVASPTDGLISPEMYQQFVLPYRMELHKHVLSKGVHHIYDHVCGEQNKNLPLLASLPWGDPGILSLGREVDLLAAAEIFPNEIICGNIDPSLVANGTPDEIYEACRANIEIGKQIKSGFAFMGGCELPVNTPPYHIHLMDKACHEFGAY